MLLERLQPARTLAGADFEALAAPHDEWRVSLYLPTHEKGKEVRQDPIRLKNRLSDAEHQLAERGVERQTIEAMLEPLRELCDFDTDENQEFWAHQGRGLAALIAPDEVRLFKTVSRLPEETVVARQFAIRPLLAAAQRNGEYAVIAASRGGVRYFEGTAAGLDETPVEDLPESLQTVLSKDHHKGFNLHSFRVRSRDADAAVPHGHVDKDEFEGLRRYFNAIVEALVEAESGVDRPLVFAGVEELFPYFRDAAEGTPLRLVSEPIAGNPDDQSPDDLHDKAWPMASEKLGELVAAAKDRYRSQEHTDLASDDLQEVVTASQEGRVELLIVESTKHPLGSFDPTQRRVVLDEAEDSEGIDLLDLAAAKTLATGGGVLVLSSDDFGLSQSGVAAVYRYAAG